MPQPDRSRPGIGGGGSFSLVHQYPDCGLRPPARRIAPPYSGRRLADSSELAAIPKLGLVPRKLDLFGRLVEKPGQFSS